MLEAPSSPFIMRCVTQLFAAAKSLLEQPSSMLYAELINMNDLTKEESLSEDGEEAAWPF